MLLFGYPQFIITHIFFFYRGCVSNALRAGYLNKNFTFFESFIGKHEKFGPMLLPEINSQEVRPQFENLKIYDDIPEEDEIVILE